MEQEFFHKIPFYYGILNKELKNISTENLMTDYIEYRH